MSRTIKDADLNDYLYYAEVVAHGGFAAASRVLHIPKSKLSRRISRLEDRLGVCLIERSTRHFRVTDLGRSFYLRCRAIIEEAQLAEAIVAEAKSEPRGDVRFSCPTGLLEIVAPTLPLFLTRYPDVRLQMLAMDRPVDLLHEGVDLALRVRTKLDGGTTLKMRSLGISRKILVSDRQFAAAIGGDIDKLGDVPTLGTSEEPGEAEWTLVGPSGQTKRVRHDPRMRCSDLAAIRDAAAMGMGVALLPDHTCREHLAQGKLVRILPEWHSPDGFVHVVFTARKGLPAAVRAFLDHLIEAFPPGMLSDRAPEGPRPPQVQGGSKNAPIPVAAS
jgi:DNA-binding transcriptional LysR family regulator